LIHGPSRCPLRKVEGSGKLLLFSGWQKEKGLTKETPKVIKSPNPLPSQHIGDKSVINLKFLSPPRLASIDTESNFEVVSFIILSSDGLSDYK